MEVWMVLIDSNCSEEHSQLDKWWTCQHASRVRHLDLIASAQNSLTIQALISIRSPKMILFFYFCSTTILWTMTRWCWLERTKSAPVACWRSNWWWAQLILTILTLTVRSESLARSIIAFAKHRCTSFNLPWITRIALLSMNVKKAKV